MRAGAVQPAAALLVMGMPAWNQLPEEASTVLQEAAQQTAEYERALNADMKAEQLASLRKSGMEINEPPDIEAFQSGVEPIHEQYGERFGDYLPRIREAIGE